MFTIIYVVVAVVVGGYAWRLTAGTWSSGSVWSHAARAVLLTVGAGVMWPGALALFALYQCSSSCRRFINNALEDRSERD